MTAPALDLELYFRRIGHEGARAPTLATLAALHARHTESIPFENLSPLMGETVALAPEALSDKLLRSGRGGYCFEHNLLFQYALEALGYDVTPLAARVRWNCPPGTDIARTHMLLLVRIDSASYIADVGFGGVTLTSPLRFEMATEQATRHEAFRLLPVDDGVTMEVKLAGQWRCLYWFDLQPQARADYELTSWYLCNHPDSQFVNHLIAARPVADGRHALRDNRYAFRRRDGDTEERTLANVAEIMDMLRTEFDISLPDPGALERRLAGLPGPAASTGSEQRLPRS